MGAGMDELAERVRSALSSGDVEAYRELLAPDAHWGPADSPTSGCRNRDQILDWYRASRDEGIRATVQEVVQGRDSLLVGLSVSGRGARWQVLTVRSGQITDICGFDDREQAAERAGLAGS